MKNEIHIHYLKTSFGELILGSYQSKLCLCDWRYRKMRKSIDNRIKTGLNSDYIEKPSPIIDDTIVQLNEYFDSKRKEFSIPILFIGTDFQKNVWNTLLTIPFGVTDSYLGLSKRLENEKAIRAVGTANGANAISIIVPCHRIIGSNDKLIGYAGGLETKKKLLLIENSLPVSQLSLF